jgi:hypothetical protein
MRLWTTQSITRSITHFTRHASQQWGERCVSTCSKSLSELRAHHTIVPYADGTHACIPLSAPLSKRKQAEQHQRLSRRRARYEAVCQLRAEGWTLSAIADQLGLDRNTVRTYMQAPAFPERQARSPQPSLLDPYKPYILERWNGAVIPAWSSCAR